MPSQPHHKVMSTIRMHIPSEQLKKFNTALAMYTQGLRKEANRTLVEHARLLARDLVRWTPPPEGKQQGENAVMRDISNAIRPYTTDTITDPVLADRLEKIAKQKDYEAFRAIQKNLPGIKQFTVSRFNREMHSSVRIHGDRMRISDKKRLTLDVKEWKDYVKEVKARVGKLKASWLPMTEKLQVPVPVWVSRHSAYGHKVTTCNIQLGNKPSIFVWNGAAAKGYIRRAAETALQGRVVRMARDLAYKVRYMKRKLGQMA